MSVLPLAVDFVCWFERKILLRFFPFFVLVDIAFLNFVFLMIWD